jgi:hypothetical protein
MLCMSERRRHLTHKFIDAVDSSSNVEKVESYQAQVRCQEEEITCLKEKLNNSVQAAQSLQAKYVRITFSGTVLTPL